MMSNSIMWILRVHANILEVMQLSNTIVFLKHERLFLVKRMLQQHSQYLSNQRKGISAIMISL